MPRKRARAHTCSPNAAIVPPSTDAEEILDLSLLDIFFLSSIDCILFFSKMIKDTGSLQIARTTLVSNLWANLVTVYPSFCNCKVALSKWLSTTIKCAIGCKFFSPSDSWFQPYVKENLREAEICPTFTQGWLLVKSWDLSKSSPNRRLSEEQGVAKWFCKEFDWGWAGVVLGPQ